MVDASGRILGLFELGRGMRSHCHSEDSLRNLGGLFLLSFFITAGSGGLLSLLISSFGRVDHDKYVVAFCG